MKQNWFLLGDIHGEAAAIEYFYNHHRERLKLDDCQTNIILLGDVGLNYSITGLADFYYKTSLSKLPFTYICLRGNHESRVSEVIKRNPSRWNPIEKYGGLVYVENDFPNIEYLVDGPAIYEFAGYKTLSLPGAYSVDKWLRLANGWQWFADEQLSEEEMQYGRMLVNHEKSVDLVISHTCPIEFEPNDLFLGSIDQSQVDKTMELYLGEIENQLDYRRWVWGHYHADRLYPWKDGKEKLMLFNEHVVDLCKFMEMGKADYFVDILA